MSFPLESFEANLPAGMVRKGEAYWMDDTVRGLAFDGSQWEAFVYGSEKYTVRLSLFKDEVVDWSCDCPYDWGSICKHVIAVLFAIRENGSEIMERVAVNQDDESIKNRKEAQKSTLGPITQIIGQMDEATLRESLHYLSQRHNEVSSHLLAKYAHLLPGTDSLQILAVKATRTQEQAQVLIEQLDSSIESKSKEKYSQYALERLANLKYNLLRKYYPSHEAEHFLQSNLVYTSFREMAVQAAIDEQKYKQAERLAEEGIQEDTINRFPGLVTKWKDYLLQIARITNDKEAQIRILEQLFFSNADMNDYRQLKALHTPAGFSKRIEEYIHHFRMREKQYFRGQPYFNERVANILQEENRLNELMEELLKSPELYRLDHYFTILSEQYTADYINAYDQAIRNEMKHSSDRKAYSNCCYYLQKMEKLGGMEQVARIVKDWRQKYPRRRALLEELAKRRW